MSGIGTKPGREVIAGADKVILHRDKVESFLRGERVLPVTVELDITTECNLNCPDCASAGRPVARRLGLATVRDLFSALAGETRGLLLSGGEPTGSPDFPAVVRAARASGFEDVVVVSNGSTLDDPTVASSLLADVSAVRVSLYDWDDPADVPNSLLLRKIEHLRERVVREGSGLEIGISALTTGSREAAVPSLVEAVRSAGAHWVYFHPYCTGWESGHLAQVDQGAVAEAVRHEAAAQRDGFRVFSFPERFSDGAPEFEGYHAAHFLLVIGADGGNYLSTELKYLPEFEIGTLNGSGIEQLLWSPERLARIETVPSTAYPALAARHRGVLYSALLSSLRSDSRGGRLEPARRFKHPHVL